MKKPASLFGKHLFAFALITVAACAQNGDAPSLNALREIKVERQTILRLGGKMPQGVDVCDWTGTTCTLKQGTFGGAKTMSLTESESGLIARFCFYYGFMATDGMKEQIDSYKRLLGKPSKDSTVRKGSLDVRKVAWADAATSFDLSYKIGQTKAEASATLSDNALARPSSTPAPICKP
jgi:hypothetical protein